MGQRCPLGTGLIFCARLNFPQGGHSFTKTEAEAREENETMLDVYETFARDHPAIPVYSGEKLES